MVLTVPGTKRGGQDMKSWWAGGRELAGCHCSNEWCHPGFKWGKIPLQNWSKMLRTSRRWDAIIVSSRI